MFSTWGVASKRSGLIEPRTHSDDAQLREVTLVIAFERLVRVK